MTGAGSIARAGSFDGRGSAGGQRSGGRQGSAWQRSAEAYHPALRPATGFALVAIGAILLIAVHIRTGFLNPAPAGLVLLAVGLAWLWLPVRDKRGLLRRQANRLRYLLARDTGLPRGARVPLTDLLSQPQQVAADPAGEAGQASDIG